MRFTVESTSFVKSFQLAASCCGRRDIKPLLKNVLCKALDGGGATLTATDLEVAVSVKVAAAKVEQPGECLLPAETVAAILNEADGELAFELDGGGLLVKGERSEYEIPEAVPGQFPAPPAWNAAAYHEIPGTALARLISRTIFAAARTDNAVFGATTGVVWECGEGTLRLIATDGRRLAVSDAAAVREGQHPPSSTIFYTAPARAMTLIATLAAAAGEEPCRVHLPPTNNELLFSSPQAVVHARLLEGRYPDYRRVLPESGKWIATVPFVAGALLVAARQASIMTADDTRRVDFLFNREKLTATARGQGRSRVEIPVEYPGKKSFTVSLDPNYLLSALKACDKDEHLLLDLLDPKKPILLRNESGDWRCVLVPLVPTEA